MNKILRWTARILAAVVVIILLAFLFLFHSGLYHRFILFPKQAKAWEKIRLEHITPAFKNDWPEFKGVLHAHSHFSHDSDASFAEITATLKQTGCSFICMSDHCVEGKADYSIQPHGLKDGILFLPGYEMSEGFMPWGLPDSTVFDCGGDYREIAKQVAKDNGVLFYAHSEEERMWELPELTGMEIYNIHSNLLQLQRSKELTVAKLLPDLLLCLGPYPDQTLRLVFRRPEKILSFWDQMNEVKKVVGISANDTHQNSGVRGYYTDHDTFLLKMTNKDVVGEYKLNGLKRTLLRLFFGPLEPGKQLFRWELDPYIRSTSFVHTHLLMKELTEPALLDALRTGRAFIGFDMIADSTGFAFFAENKTAKAVMGETLPYSPEVVLKAASPLPCRFTVKHAGQQVYQTEGTEMTWKPDAPGKYRVEAELSLVKEWVPWVYTNPLELK